MRKKWGIILGLTGMMLLGSQSIYAAEAADGTAETTDAANEKETAGTDDIESRIKKGGFTAGDHCFRQSMSAVCATGRRRVAS